MTLPGSFAVYPAQSKTACFTLRQCLAAAIGLCLAGALAPADARAENAGKERVYARIEAGSHDGGRPRVRPSRSPNASAISPYYIEFRSRTSPGYGHSYIVYGQLTSKGTIKSRHYAGLYPNDEALLVVGHVIPVAAYTTGHPQDRDDSKVTAALRINLNREQYSKVSRVVKQEQHSTRMWHISLSNCNTFVRNIAEKIGLRVPASTMVRPRQFVSELKALNPG